MMVLLLIGSLHTSENWSIYRKDEVDGIMHAAVCRSPSKSPKVNRKQSWRLERKKT